MKRALKKFVTFWKEKEEVIGILLTGSYAIGLESENSDIDIRIILYNNKRINYKGVQEIDGFYFSYWACSRELFTKNFNLDFFNSSKFEVRLFHLGQILYEEKGVILELKEIAKYYYELPFLKKRISEDNLKSMMYSLYLRYSGLKSTTISSPFFIFNYMLFMQLALQYYSSTFTSESLIINSKLDRQLTDKNYVSKYNLELLPDREFVELWIKNLSKEKINFESASEIYNYLKNKMYDFSLKKFKISWKE